MVELDTAEAVPPEEVEELGVDEAQPRTSGLTVAVVAALPFVLFCMGMVGRIAYLQVRYGLGDTRRPATRMRMPA